MVNDKHSQWWLKSNYVSILNLGPTIRRIGPLTNFWDGGGKGERYIQEIKPHIPRGVRDGKLFFVRLMEKVYKMDCLKKIESSIPDAGNNPDPDSIRENSSLSSAVSSLESLGLELGLEMIIEHLPYPLPPTVTLPILIEDESSSTSSVGDE